MRDLKILQHDFYSSKTTVDLAKSLLGKYLVRELENTVLIGQINEVEAYLQNDPASHSFKGLTNRTSPMFEEPGTVYVYFTYGKHWCFNIAGNNKGIGEGVLIRSVIPLVGIDTMLKNRGVESIENISNGPGKITKAYQIDASFNGHKIWNPPLYIATDDTKIEENRIESTSRIGITKNKDAMLRFVLKDFKTA